MPSQKTETLEHDHIYDIDVYMSYYLYRPI